MLKLAVFWNNNKRIGPYQYTFFISYNTDIWMPIYISAVITDIWMSIYISVVITQIWMSIYISVVKTQIWISKKK